MHFRREFIICLVLKVINGGNIVIKYFQIFKTIFNASRRYLYAYLKNILKTVSLIIMEDTVMFQILKKDLVTPFPVHVNKVITFVQIDYLSGCPFTKYCKF